MSEHIIDFELKIEKAQVKLWEILLQGLCNEELGAYFEERIEPFGEQAEAALEKILDDWDERNAPPSFANYQRTGCKVHFSIIAGRGVRDDINCIKSLFSLCGATVKVIPSFVDDEEVDMDEI